MRIGIADRDIFVDQSEKRIRGTDDKIESRKVAEIVLLQNADMGIFLEGDFEISLRIFAWLDDKQRRIVLGGQDWRSAW